MPARCNVRSGRPTIAVLAALIQLLLVTKGRAEQLSIETVASAVGVPAHVGTAEVNGARLYYRDLGPRAEAIVLLHGFPETGDVFAPVVRTLGHRYRLIVPDLRGAGLSQRTASGYDKKTMATDIKELMDQLKIERVHLVGHDIGARVAYAFAAQHPERLRSLMVAEAFIEGLAGTPEFKQFAPSNPRTKHFFQFAKVNEAVATHEGKEEELVLWFMNSRSKTRKFTELEVARYTASLRRDGGLRAAFMLYEALDGDAAFAAGADVSKLVALPVLAIACQGPFGNTLQRQLVAAGFKNVKGAILDGCAHWIFDENPDETLPVIQDFLGTVGSAPSAGAQ